MGTFNKLYTGLALGNAYACWLATQWVRKLLNRKHPLGWSLEEDRLITLVKVALSAATVETTRSLQQHVVNTNTVDGVAALCVPAATFETPGFRDSYWISLSPDSQPDSPKTTATIMYLHGGAFRAGLPLLYMKAYKAWLQRLADHGINARILAVGYPLAPENKWPVPVQAVVEAYQWLVKQQGGSDNIILAGDSAGGNLVLTSLEYMRSSAARASVPPPSAPAAAAAAVAPFKPPLAAVAISPATDFRFTAPSCRAPDTSYDYLSPKTFDNVRRLYLPKGWTPECLTNSLLSPSCINDFRGMVQKELLVLAGGSEVLLGDINEFVNKVKSGPGGLTVRYHVEKDQPHCYCVLALQDLVDRGADVLVRFIVDMLKVKG